MSIGQIIALLVLILTIGFWFAGNVTLILMILLVGLAIARLVP